MTIQKVELKDSLPSSDIDSSIIPEDWKLVKLSDISDFTRKKGTDLSKFDKIGFIPMEKIPIGSLYNEGYLLKKFDEISSGVYCEKGDILFAKITPSLENGKLAIVSEVPNDFAIATTEVYPIKPKIGTDRLFLYYFLSREDVRNELASSMEGTTGRKRLPKDVIRNMLIAFPSFPEQQKIAFILSKIHQVIEQQERIIETTRNLKRSIMQKLFTEGIGHAEFKETEIGQIPKEWDVVQLKAIVEKTFQKNPSRNPDNVFKYIDVSSISRDSLTIIDYKEYLGKDAPSRARKMVKKDDIIFATVRPSLKRVAIIPDDFNDEICSTAFCVIKCVKKKALTNFVFNYIITDNFITRITEFQKGSSYPAVSDGEVLQQKIPLPSISEQQQIAHLFSTLDEKLVSEQKKKDIIQELFKTLLHKLMTGEIRVKDVDLEGLHAN